MQQVYLAVDIGGSSGRVVAGEFDGRTIALEEVYRFETVARPPMTVCTGICSSNGITL